MDRNHRLCCCLFIVHFKLYFWKDFILFRVAVDVAWTVLILCSFCWLKRSKVTNVSVAAAREEKVTLGRYTKKTKRQNNFLSCRKNKQKKTLKKASL